MDKILITTNELAFKNQVDLNQSWVDIVNKALPELTEYHLADEDYSLFVKNPAALADKIVSGELAEFEGYKANLPASVARSISFQSATKDRICAIHNNHIFRPYQLIDETEIINGVCVLTEEGKERLREKCSIYGTEKLKGIWDKACKLAAELNELREAITVLNGGVDAIGIPFNTVGLVVFDRTASETYKANSDVLKMLQR